MPMYEYECAEHGVFDEMRSMARASEAVECPICRVPSPRILSAPRLRAAAAHVVRAHDVNERSRHEPRVTQRHQHGPHCNHGPTGEGARPKLQKSATSRPWVLEHG